MKYKISLFIDSLLSSSTNFLITFLLLKHSGNESVVSFGVAMTLSLILLSFQRTIILLPYNLIKDKENSSVAFNLLSCSIIIFSVSIAFICIFVLLSNNSGSVLFFSCFLFSYLFFHELVRYIFMTSSYLFFPAVISFILFFSVFQSVFFTRLSLGFLSSVYLILLSVEFMAITIYYLTLPKTSDVRKSMFYWFINPKLLLNRNLQSVSQLFLVHAPFLFVSYFLSSNISAFLFVSRSIYQPVQIIIKSFEAIDQRELSKRHEGIFEFVNKNFYKYLLISSFSSFICFFIGYFMLNMFYDLDSIPPVEDLIFWLVVFICLSSARSIEMLLIKFECYVYMNVSYILSGFLVIILLVINLFFYSDGLFSPSLLIMLGWLSLLTMLLIYYRLKYKHV